MEDLNEEIDCLKCEWLQEINLKRQELYDENCDINPNRFDIARRVYLCGLKAEGKGELQIAVEQYRRATLLVPDIERRMRPYLQTVESDQNRKDCRPEIIVALNEVSGEDGQHSVILTLPDELLLYIMRWIVGTDIDLYSLLLITKVCHKFLSLSRDEQLWRLVCQRLWPFCGQGDPLDYGGTWRSMAISRPHLLYHGCYIGSVTYVRRGEPTMSVFSGPILIVRYYRVLRFRADGSVMMVTSACEPQDIVKHIASLEEPSLAGVSAQVGSQNSIAVGTYSIDGSTVWLQLTRRRLDLVGPRPTYQHKKHRLEEPSHHLMDISLSLKPSLSKPNHVLLWNSFSLTVVRKSEALLSDFDVSSYQYPRLVFSPVRSFCARLSQSPL